MTVLGKPVMDDQELGKSGVALTLFAVLSANMCMCACVYMRICLCIHSMPVCAADWF